MTFAPSPRQLLALTLLFLSASFETRAQRTESRLSRRPSHSSPLSPASDPGRRGSSRSQVFSSRRRSSLGGDEFQTSSSSGDVDASGRRSPTGSLTSSSASSPSRLSATRPGSSVRGGFDFLKNYYGQTLSGRSSLGHRFRAEDEKRARNASKPNVVVVLCDDLDVELGSLEFMPKTMKILREGGANFHNAFTTTPMCCPSRSSFLTGMYVHNHNVYTNNDNCSGTHWRKNHETRSFATFLSNVGYRTGYFGKYLNEYDGSYIPPGWREWVGLIKNSRFYNYSINFNGRKIKHGDDYHRDYFTDLIVNDSVTFLKQSKQYFPDMPVAMVLSMPAPHGPEDAAPQHQHLFENITTHRTPAWNFAPNMDKQWLLQWTGKMEPIQKEFTHVLHRKRLQTLQAVDDAVQKVYDELLLLDQLDNTYIMFTSDHGYHLGQFGLVKGKAMPYEFDIRIPFLIRGPNIPEGSEVDSPIALLDVAPTILDIAGVDPQPHFDGRSVLKLLETSRSGGGVRKKKAWRDTLLIERGKITLRQIKAREVYEFGLNSMAFLSRNSRFNIECSKEDFQWPCKKGQKWFCQKNGANKWRMHKCRGPSAHGAPFPSGAQGIPDKALTQQCVCAPSPSVRRLPSDHRSPMLADSALHRNFKIDRKNRFKPDRKYRKKKLKKGGYFNLNGNHKRRFKRRGVSADLAQLGSASPFKLCNVLPNNSVLCDQRIYSSYQFWKEERENVEDMIQRFRNYINNLKHIRKHLKYLNPDDSKFTFSTTPLATTTTTSTTTTTTTPATYSSEKDEFKIIHGRTDYLSATTSSFSGAGQSRGVVYSRPPIGIPQSSFPPANPSECDCGEHERSFRKWRRRHPWWQGINRGIAPSTAPNHEVAALDDRDGTFRKSENYLIDMLPPVQPPYLPEKDKYFSWNNIRKKDLAMLSGWSKKKLSKKEKRKMGKDQHFECNIQNMNCFKQDNDHWKTPPYWTLGPFCSCPNSNNNTYWCTRTINSTHNFLYCEFITGFISYYNIRADPYQLRNAVHDLDYGVLQQLHKTLNRLRACKGKECNVRNRGVDALEAESARETIQSAAQQRRASKLKKQTPKSSSLNYRSHLMAAATISSDSIFAGVPVVKKNLLE